MQEKRERSRKIIKILVVVLILALAFTLSKFNEITGKYGHNPPALQFLSPPQYTTAHIGESYSYTLSLYLADAQQQYTLTTLTIDVFDANNQLADTQTYNLLQSDDASVSYLQYPDLNIVGWVIAARYIPGYIIVNNQFVRLSTGFYTIQATLQDFQGNTFQQWTGITIA